ncbi:efflux RND transporter periplasmic adaptor subunit [Caulobacter sp. NIBR2454]|uniref:efflux RND transporter periplasmic adaptor subunit n=1 Tax=Caulobacter sp. NIBR2454 TaxID=3015996 RepID=UPI0022B604DF|nr:efflux RND transporter periplasmic adaptor subunit [Caulobacter sp. NIBR2454]
MIRRHFFLVAALVVLAVMIVGGGIKLLADSGAKKQIGGGPGGRAIAVSQTEAASRAFADRIEVLGLAKGQQSVAITSNTTELVTKVHFSDGQRVRAGQILVELKAGEEDAGITQAQAQLNQAERDYQRWKTLADQGIAPRVQAEQYRLAVDTARAGLEAARQRLGDRVIRAPFAGQVGLTDVTAGTLISPGQTVVTLDDTSTMRVDFAVPDRYLPILREGLGIVASPDAYPDVKVSGRIARLDTRIDENTRAITARAEFPNGDGRLKPGMMVRVAIEQGQRNVVAAPQSAVQFEGDQAFVFAIVKQGERTVAQKRPVTTGLDQNGFVEITGGLQPGEKIVADGLNRVQDGQAVQVGGGRPQGPGQGGRPNRQAG